jgi:hypothetical protein
LTFSKTTYLRSKRKQAPQAPQAKTSILLLSNSKQNQATASRKKFRKSIDGSAR